MGKNKFLNGSNTKKGGGSFLTRADNLAITGNCGSSLGQAIISGPFYDSAHLTNSTWKEEQKQLCNISAHLQNWKP